MLGQKLELLIQHLQALLRNVVRRHIVDGDLQPLQPRAVQALNALGHQQVAVGNHAGNHAARADAPDNVVEIRVKQRLAAADGNDRRAQLRQLVDAPEHGLGRNRLREVVKLVAVLAGKIAAPHRDDVRQQRMVRRQESPGDHLRATQVALQRAPAASQFCLGRNHGEIAKLLKHKAYSPAAGKHWKADFPG